MDVKDATLMFLSESAAYPAVAELAVERARYDADRAERAFCAGSRGRDAGGMITGW